MLLHSRLDLRQVIIISWVTLWNLMSINVIFHAANKWRMQPQPICASHGLFEISLLCLMSSSTSLNPVAREIVAVRLISWFLLLHYTGASCVGLETFCQTQSIPKTAVHLPACWCNWLLDDSNFWVWKRNSRAYFTKRDWLNQHRLQSTDEWLGPRKSMGCNYSSITNSNLSKTPLKLGMGEQLHIM